MPARKRSLTENEQVTWWKDKLSRMEDRTFVMPEYGPRIHDLLLAEPSGCVQGSDLKQLGARLGVPLKFLPRAIASVTRLGIVTAILSGSPLGLTIHRNKLARRKFAMGRSRQRLSKDAREAIRVASNNRCACCGKSLTSERWVLDHIIPLSLLGADAEANLVPMLKACNATKWDRLTRRGLRYYRGESVNGRFGVRFINGEFWPVINGKVRRSRAAT